MLLTKRPSASANGGACGCKSVARGWECRLLRPNPESCCSGDNASTGREAASEVPCSGKVPGGLELDLLVGDFIGDEIECPGSREDAAEEVERGEPDTNGERVLQSIRSRICERT